MSGLRELGVDPARFGERDYGLTQTIGAALAFLGLDGLVAPSARWPCNNLMIFTDGDIAGGQSIEPVRTEEIEWQHWSIANGLLKQP